MCLKKVSMKELKESVLAAVIGAVVGRESAEDKFRNRDNKENITTQIIDSPVISSGKMESRTSRSSICSSRPIFPSFAPFLQLILIF